jgi:hypothetical protein
LKFTKKDEVFQDTVTGVCYTKEYALRPIAIIESPGKVTKFGVLLKPYCGENAPAWVDDFEAMASEVGELGYPARDIGQSLMVTEEQFATRFKSLGSLSREIDLDRLVAHYEEEACDFSNRPAVIRSVTQQLKRMGTGLWACEVFTLLKDYIANTPANKQ